MDKLFVLFWLIMVVPVYAATPPTPFIERKPVLIFIEEMVKKHKFKKNDLIALFKGAKVRPQVISHVKKPLEKQPWHLYQMLFVSEWRIQHGVIFWNKYASVLKKAEQEFGVPAAIIVATIGVETRYGQRTGDFRVIDSLTNLAFSDSPRAGFFRKELEEFLLLTREQKLDPLKIMGSYAGAIGQPQFMPSSYRYYAINFSKSGKTDLMHDEVDIIGSIANYYKKHGWTPSEPVAEPVSILGNRYQFLKRTNNVAKSMTIKEWGNYGVVPKNKIAHEKLPSKMIELDSRYNKEYWLGFHNFDVIKRYNTSDLYAMAVFQLSHYIADLRERLNKG